MNLLRDLCSVRSVSGDELPIRNFLINYINKESDNWKNKPTLLFGNELQDCLVLVFGKPRTAIFAHIDTIGFTVGYGRSLIKIGGPAVRDGFRLWGKDSKGDIDCRIVIHPENNQPYHDFHREIDRGTCLSFYPDFRETKQFVQSCYMDNRLGIYNALRVAETLDDGLIIFSCYEEHGGGTVGFLANLMVNQYKVYQALISDITWVTDGVQHGKGTAISMRDSGIPRKVFLNKVIDLAKESKIPFQLEVESAGGSDGSELQKSPYPIDWCFIGAPENFVHTPDEKVHKSDIKSMINLYQYLMQKL
jgi:putative aminopeptidase FrvX